RRPCDRCKDNYYICEYQDGKREKQKRHVRDLEEKIQSYERLFYEIRDKVDIESQRAIDEALIAAQVCSKENGIWSLDKTLNLEYDHEGGHTGHQSIGPLERLMEDINTVTVNQPMGYMGRGSEVSWLRLLRAELDFDEEMFDPNDFHHLNSGIGGIAVTNDITCSTYHLDDINLSLSGENGQVDVYFIPPRELADQLVHAYFSSVEPFIPMIDAECFMEQYDKLYTSNGGSVTEIQSRWLIVINLIFAIGGRYYESMGRVLSPDIKHLSYLQRARILGALDGGQLFNIATLHEVQVLALAGMYLLSSKHTNRSWNVVGIALRLAHGLGLNLHNDDPALTSKQRDMRVRTWYSLVYLETTLCLVTGRPSGIQAHASIGPIPDDPYYLAVAKLCTITGTIQSELDAARCPDAVAARNASEAVIAKHQRRLQRWRDELHETLENIRHTNEEDLFQRKRIDLTFRYHNALLILHFASLATLSTHSPFPSVTTPPTVLLASTLSILSTITAGPNLMPWWCYLHYLVTAEAVLMLLMVHRHATPELFARARQPLAWLETCGSVDLASARTLWQLDTLLARVETKVLRAGGMGTGAEERVLEADAMVDMLLR
ncbi:fungal-specific transcription factor domain-containing protein, partial [Geopyxis carbonaria]